MSPTIARGGALIPTTEGATLVPHCRVGALISHHTEVVLWSFTAEGRASGYLTAEGVLWSLTVEGVET